MTDLSLGHWLWAWAGAAVSHIHTNKDTASVQESGNLGSTGQLCRRAAHPLLLPVPWLPAVEQTKPCSIPGASLGAWDAELCAVFGEWEFGCSCCLEDVLK